MGVLLSLDEVLEKHRAAWNSETDDRTELLLKHLKLACAISKVTDSDPRSRDTYPL